MIREGTRVAYVGMQTKGRAIGDEAMVVQAEINYAHVRWTTGDHTGDFDMVPNGDLVANGSLASHPLTADSFDTGLIDFDVTTVLHRKGSLGLFNALNGDGHLAQLPSFVDEAIALLATRIRHDPSVVEVLAKLDDEDASEFVTVACMVALRDAFEDT